MSRSARTHFSPSVRRFWWSGAAVLLAGLPVLAATPARRRPESHPHFEQGAIAFSRGQWREAAEKMLDAYDTWPDEDGLLTRVTDRWFRPYVPLVFRSAALAEMGCRDEAMAALDRSSRCLTIPTARRRVRQECLTLIDRTRHLTGAAAPKKPSTDCSRVRRLPRNKPQ